MMKLLRALLKALVALLVAWCLTTNAMPEESKRDSAPASSSNEKQNMTSVVRPAAEPLKISLVVRDSPYQRGAEKCRASGEPEAGAPSLAILASRTFQTVQETPFLYWYLSQATACRIEVTLIEMQSGEAIIDAAFIPPLSAGIYSVTDYKHPLKPGSRYIWSVSLVPEVDDRAKDIVVSVDLEYIEPPGALRAGLARATRLTVPTIFAEAGFHYDALTAALALTREAPNAPGVREQRRALLAEVGIQESSHEDVAGHIIPEH